MTVIKSGDLVVLRSGGPVMTVDTVNTSIFDDNEITGVFCAWFDGDKLQRVRFDHRAIEPASTLKARLQEASPQATSGEYKAVMDGMVDAMNHPTDAEQATVASAPKPKRNRARKAADAPAVGASPTH